MIWEKIILLPLFCYFVLSPLLLCGQTEPDTVYYEIKSEMIDQAQVYKDTLTEADSYTIRILLKENYRAAFEKLTGDNTGNLLAVKHENEIIHPSLPVMTAKISGGQISLREYKTEQKAKDILRWILAKKDEL